MSFVQLEDTGADLYFVRKKTNTMMTQVNQSASCTAVRNTRQKKDKYRLIMSFAGWYRLQPSPLFLPDCFHRTDAADDARCAVAHRSIVVSNDDIYSAMSDVLVDVVA